uniref:Uncharacterized protein n=1 Tax=Tetradesmus obliquus TaxID=3088 RepID=A0A383WB20_TETOB|eukprot:jgi/Sobl393_1/11134/SZX74641.1
MAAAERHNAAGNAAFKDSKFQEAADHYTKAIQADRSVAKYRTNRANALWKGLALERLGRFSEAVQFLKAAVELELSQQVAVALHRCQESLRQQRAFCLGRFDSLTQFMHNSIAEARSTLQLHCHKMRPDSNGTQLLKAYEAVVQGNAL